MLSRLFKILDDLTVSAETMEQLYSILAYIGSLENRKKEFMVGYSDSAKEAVRTTLRTIFANDINAIQLLILRIGRQSI